LGVVLTSTDARELRVTLGRPVPGVRIGLVSTVGFGLWSAIFAIATRQYSWIAMVLLLRATSFVFIGTFVASRSIDLRVFRARDLRPQIGDRGVELGVTGRTARLVYHLVGDDSLTGTVEVGAGLRVLDLGDGDEEETAVRKITRLSRADAARRLRAHDEARAV